MIYWKPVRFKHGIYYFVYTNKLVEITPLNGSGTLFKFIFKRKELFVDGFVLARYRDLKNQLVYIGEI